MCGEQLVLHCGDKFLSHDDAAVSSDLDLLDLPYFYNQHGSLRVGLVRKYFGLDSVPSGSRVKNADGFYRDQLKKVQVGRLLKKDLSDIARLYVHWRDTCEFMPLRLTYKDVKNIDLKGSACDPETWINSYKAKWGKSRFAAHFNDNPGCKMVVYEGTKEEWRLMKASKRGNDVYIRQVEDKLKPLTLQEPLTFFSTELNSNRSRNRKTNVLYLTGTVDTSKFTVSESWIEFGKWWNTFITNLRNQFGGAEYIRAWQSQKNGYPHWHAIIHIPFDFSVVPWREKDKKGKDRLTWRVSSVQKLHKGDKLTVRQRLKSAWSSYGNLDIIAVSDLKDTFTDMLKYITRELEGGESDLTNAMVWYFGKQSYSITRNFVTALWGDDALSIDSAEPSNADLITGLSSNSNSELIQIEVFPMVLRSDLDFFYQKDILMLEKEPDPPPPVVDYLENLVDFCKVSSVRQRDDGVRLVVYKYDD